MIQSLYLFYIYSDLLFVPESLLEIGVFLNSFLFHLVPLTGWHTVIQLFIGFCYNSLYFCNVDCNVPTFISDFSGVCSLFFSLVLAKGLSIVSIISKNQCFVL